MYKKTNEYLYIKVKTTVLVLSDMEESKKSSDLVSTIDKSVLSS